MMNLQGYLETIPAGIARERARSTLTKLRNVEGIGLTTDADLAARVVAQGNAALTFSFGYGKKRDGLRAPKKPEWSLWWGDTGCGVSRLAAGYTNFLLGGRYDMAAIEARVTAEYERESTRGRY